MRRILGYACLALFVLPALVDSTLAAPGVQIISETAAARHGLTRPWFIQAQVDRTQGKIEHMVLCDGTLFVQTDCAVLQAIDAETGQTLWTKEIGRRGFPSSRPAASQEMVAVVNGSTLYVLHRQTGRLLWCREVDGVPGAGPALSQLRAYVPTTDGLVLAYRLEAVVDPAVELGMLDPESEADAQTLKARRLESLKLHQELKPPLACQSFGRAMVQPLIIREEPGEESVAWPTDRGYLFVGRIDRTSEDWFEMVYKLETGADITARPTFLPAATEEASDSGILFAPSQDGFLHAIRERNGKSMWRFPTGEPVVQPAAPIGDRVYVTTQLGGMYCLAVATGQQLWWTPGIMKFIAASKDRVYATDRSGNLVVLHAQSGGRLDAIPTSGLTIKLMNLQNDRIYLASETGLIQCLHEVELTTPLLHRPKPMPKEEKPEPTKTEVPQQAEEKAPAKSPFESGGATAPGTDSPFGGGSDPFGGGGAAPSENPFGGGTSGGSDPFGGGGAAPSENPFGGGASGGSDPFGGGGAAPGGDPFGGGGASGGSDPFGGGGNSGGAPAPDPFG